MMISVKREGFLLVIPCPVFSWETLTFKAPPLPPSQMTSFLSSNFSSVLYFSFIFIQSGLVQCCCIISCVCVPACACACVRHGTDKWSTKISSLTCCWESRVWKFRLSVSDSSYASNSLSRISQASCWDCHWIWIAMHVAMFVTFFRNDNLENSYTCVCVFYWAPLDSLSTLVHTCQPSFVFAFTFHNM